MSERQEQDVKRLQDNLETIRKVAGWSAEDLGNKLGVSKQSIRNLETRKNLMSRTQYIAIRAVLDYKIASNDSESDALRRVVNAILDSEEEDLEDISEGSEAETQIMEADAVANDIENAKAKKASSSRKKVAAVAAGVAVTAIAPWLVKVLKDSSKK